MNLNILRDKKYISILEDILCYKVNFVNGEFPFHDYYINENDLNFQNLKFSNYINFLKSTYFFCEFDQHYYGLVNIQNNDYIISVNDECVIRIVGNDEINWIKSFLSHFDDYENRYDQFKNICIENYSIYYKEIDYEEIDRIENSYIPDIY